MNKLLISIGAALVITHLFWSSPVLALESENQHDIEIVEGENRTIYEYRQNGYLVMIKVVPKVGLPYYMVPADGEAHYQSLDHKKKLYPRWVILEW